MVPIFARECTGNIPAARYGGIDTKVLFGSIEVDIISFQEVIEDFRMYALEGLVSLLALRENMIVSTENRTINNAAHQLTSGLCNPGSTI